MIIFIIFKVVRKRRSQNRLRRIIAEEKSNELRRTRGFGENENGNGNGNDKGIKLFPHQSALFKRSASEPPSHLNQNSKGRFIYQNIKYKKELLFLQTKFLKE